MTTPPPASTPPSAYPHPGTLFPSLAALSTAVHAVVPAAIADLAGGPVELLERKRGDEVCFKCKLGTRKPGRRKKGERRKSADELCSFRLVAVRQSSSTAPTATSSGSSSTASSSAAYVVKSFTPHSATSHELGWTGHEDDPVRSSRSDRADPTPVNAPTPASDVPAPSHPPGIVTDPTGSPQRTLLTRGGTHIPLLPLLPFAKFRVKPRRPAGDAEHVGETGWEAWRACWWGEEEAEGEHAARSREERKRVERMGGYGALREWGWCEGLLEPVSEEEGEEPCEEERAADKDVEAGGTGAAENQGDGPAYKPLERRAPKAQSSSPIDGSPTRSRMRDPPAARGRKRSRGAADPEWLPTTAARSQRCATRAPSFFENEEGDVSMDEHDDERFDGASESTFPSDSPDTLESSPFFRLGGSQQELAPISSTVAAFAPFTHAWPRASGLPSLSPPTSRDTSFEQDRATPASSPEAYTRAPIAPSAAQQPPHILPVYPSRTSIAPAQPPHPHPPRCSVEPRLPPVAEAAAPPDALLEHDAVWALLELGTGAPAVREQPHVLDPGAGPKRSGEAVGMRRERERVRASLPSPPPSADELVSGSEWYAGGSGGAAVRMEWSA